MDDYILSGDCSFINSYSKLFSKRLEETKNIITNSVSQPISSDTTPTLTFSNDSEPSFFKDIATKNKYWNKITTYRTILKYLNQTTVSAQSEDHFQKTNQDLRTKVIESALCKIEELTSSIYTIT